MIIKKSCLMYMVVESILENLVIKGGLGKVVVGKAVGRNDQQAIKEVERVVGDIEKIVLVKAVKEEIENLQEN